jgi:hypothetical protein
LNKYGLYKATPGLNDSVAKNYEELFILKKHEEDIWTKFYTPTSGGTDLAYMNNSNGYGGLSCNTPTGNLVDAFEMKDGTKFDWNNPSHAAFPYKNRDQRFYAYILYEGAKWRNRPAFSIGMDPKGIMQFGRWETWNASTSQVVYIGGLDSQWSPYTPANNSYTRYIARKFLDPNHEASLASKQDVPHRRIRYAEILLNYAESCIELGEDAEARTYLNMLRKRAGQPALTESGEALLARCRNERRVELMYEEQRFFDIRRWAIGPDAYNISVTKANILYKLLPDKTTATVPTITHEVVETRAWNNKAYFFPILRDEMNKNDKLIQNPGY